MPTPPSAIRAGALLGLVATTATVVAGADPAVGREGPLGEWRAFVPIGFITAPHPDNPVIAPGQFADGFERGSTRAWSLVVQ